MQSPKGIIQNVLVKINKFIFPIDFIILDIIEDDKFPIILGRPMLATAHARIDVFGKKISLEVGTKQITFDINERESPAIISPVCVINNFSKSNEIDELRNLEDLLMSDDIDGDLGRSARLNDDSSGMFYNPNSNSSISIDDFVEMDDLWDNLDFRDLTNKATKSPIKFEFLSSGNRIHLHSLYNLQITCKIGFVNFEPYIEPQSPFNIMSRKAYNSIMKHEIVYTGNNMVGFARNLYVVVRGHQFLFDFIILENINEFMGNGLTEVLFGQPFEEHVGIIEDQVKETFGLKSEMTKPYLICPVLKKDLVPAARRQLSRPTRPVIVWYLS
ncbi:homeodomain-like protein [Tanacetum coccineum]